MHHLEVLNFNNCLLLKVLKIRTSVHGISALLIGVINALSSLVAVAGNSLIVAAIWRNPSVRTPSFILLGGLAASDFATGLITQPLYAADMLATFISEPNSILTAARRISSKYFAIVTVETITVMAAERWLHMSRRSLLTVRRAYKICGLLLFTQLFYMVARQWVISVSSFVAFWEPFLTAFLGAVCLLTTFFSYYKVFKLIRQHERQIQAHQAGQDFAQPTINLAKYKKSVYTILYILAIFLLCYLPNIIWVSVIVLMAMFTESFAVALHVSITLFFMSSSLNPLLYCWRIKEIRDEVKLLISKLQCRGWPTSELD